MRLLLLIACYGLACLGSFLGLVEILERNFMDAALLFGSSLSVAALGFICDSVGAIREVIAPRMNRASKENVSSAFHDEWYDAGASRGNPLIRSEEGLFILATDSGELAFPSIEALTNYLKDQEK